MSHVLTTGAVERYYSTKELAEQLGTTTGTIQQWRRGGKAPQATRINGSIRYAASAVNEWIAAQNEQQDAAGERAGELVAAGALS